MKAGAVGTTWPLDSKMLNFGPSAAALVLRLAGLVAVPVQWPVSTTGAAGRARR